MRAISVPPEVAWATIHAGYRTAPVAAHGPILLHTATRSALDQQQRDALRRLAPAGPRTLPRSSLVGIVLVAEGIAAAWPLPPVHHLGSSTIFAVDSAALGRHRSAYESAWREMTLDIEATLCPYCGIACAASCFLSATAR